MLTEFQKNRLKQFLEDDAFQSDITSAMTPTKNASAVIKAKEPCTLSGLEEATYLFSRVNLTIKTTRKDGDLVHQNDSILHVAGTNREILCVERTALNVLSRMSGVATLCQKAQSMVGASTTIALTRKTVPGFNVFDKKAAKTAGIWPHRENLADAVLIKENHLRFFDSPAQAVSTGKNCNPKKMVEIEVETLDELKSAISANPDMVLLDNFSLSRAEEAVVWCRQKNPNVKIELSGGIRLSNLSAYAALQPDYISMGLLTQQAASVDFSLDFV